MAYVSPFRNNILCGFVLGVLYALSYTALAEDYDITSFHEHSPTSDELIRSLKPSQPGLGEMKTRGIQIESSKPKAVALAIQFEFDSAKLTPDAMEVLNALGNALKSKDLSANAFLVEGHTDSVGGEAYNMQLSKRRATSVTRYLTKAFGVDPGRLETAGRGQSRPLDRQNPESGVNRRVQIVTRR